MAHAVRLVAAVAAGLTLCVLALCSPQGATMEEIPAKEELGSARMPVIPERAFARHVFRNMPLIIDVETAAKAALSAKSSFPVQGGTVGDFYNSTNQDVCSEGEG